MLSDNASLKTAADRLAGLYDEEFGGKSKGRYRIAVKLLRQLMQRRRLYEQDIRALAREMLERGYVLIDMDTYFVVISTVTFTNYRRVNDAAIS